jgi:hypothetical protein
VEAIYSTWEPRGPVTHSFTGGLSLSNDTQPGTTGPDKTTTLCPHNTLPPNQAPRSGLVSRQLQWGSMYRKGSHSGAGQAVLGACLCTAHHMYCLCTAHHMYRLCIAHHIHKRNCSRAAAGMACLFPPAYSMRKNTPTNHSHNTPQQSNINQNNTHPQAMWSPACAGPLLYAKAAAPHKQQCRTAAAKRCVATQTACLVVPVKHHSTRFAPRMACTKMRRQQQQQLFQQPRALSGTANASIPSHKHTTSCCWLLVALVGC